VLKGVRRQEQNVAFFTHIGEKRNACRILVGNPEGKTPLGRPGHRWEDLDLGEIGWGGMDWIHLIEDRDQW
jgi:hypothetical protein